MIRIKQNKTSASNSLMEHDKKDNYFNIRENQFVLNKLPNDSCHFITVHFNDRIGRNESLCCSICEK